MTSVTLCSRMREGKSFHGGSIVTACRPILLQIIVSYVYYIFLSKSSRINGESLIVLEVKEVRLNS